MFLQEFLPSVESPDRDIKGFADPFHRSEAEGVLCEDAEDKTEAVAAVRDDGIREEGVCCGRIPAERTDKAADAQDSLYRFVINEVDHGALVIAMYVKTAVSAVRAYCAVGTQMSHRL